MTTIEAPPLPSNVEVIDLGAPQVHNVRYDTQAKRNCLRPRETEADIIALGIAPGSAYPRPFFQLVDDDHRCYNATTDVGDCTLCCPVQQFSPEMMLEDWGAVHDWNLRFP